MENPLNIKWSITVKFFVLFGILWALPIVLMSLFTLDHLRTIQKVTYEGARSVLIAHQSQHIKDSLTMEATKLSNIFKRLNDETYNIGSFAQNLLSSLPKHSFRNGSNYHVNQDGTYSTLRNDGNSAVFANHYESAMDQAIIGTEALDLVLKPLLERESKMVLGWLLHRQEFIRVYPWSDGKYWPRDRALTSWPFYYLADEQHNPAKKGLYTPVYLDPLSREWMISCLYPVYVNGHHEATVGIDITVQKILQEISDIRLTKGSSSLLISDSEIIAASPNFPLNTLGLNPGAPSHGQILLNSKFTEVRKLAKELHSNKQNVKLFELPGYRVMVGFATVEPLGWKLVYFVPEEEFLAPSNENATKIFAESQKIRRNFIHIVVFTLIGLIGITIFIFFYESKGIRMLLGGIRKLADGDLSHRLPEDYTEIGELAKALNSMAKSLQNKNKELQQIFDKMEQARKLSAVGRLAAGVAHEVNNPLATISTYTQMVLRRNDIPNDVSKSMRIVMSEIKRIQSHVSNLLDLTRLKESTKENINPNIIIREISSLVCNETSTRNIELRLSLCDDSLRIYADSSGIKQIIWNLLRNALDAQKKGGFIKLSTYFNQVNDNPSTFVIEMQDEGPGVSDENLPHIFEPFFSTKDIGQGTGLGLSIVSNIVKNHDGSIEVINLLPRGCLFRVILPYLEGKCP